MDKFEAAKLIVEMYGNIVISYGQNNEMMTAVTMAVNALLKDGE